MKLQDSSFGKAVRLLWQSLVNLVTGLFTKLWGAINHSLEKKVFNHETTALFMAKGTEIWNHIQAQKADAKNPITELTATQEWFAQMHTYLEELDRDEESESLRRYVDQTVLVAEVYRRLCKRAKN